MMKKSILLLFVLALFAGTTSYAQIKETIKKDSTVNQITISETGIYEGSKSNEARTFYNKAIDYEKKDDLMNALKFYLKAIDADTNYVEAYDNAGLTYRRLGEYDKAIVLYKKSILKYPSGVTAHQNLAVVYSLQKDYEGANKEYEAIIKLYPEDPEGYFGLANSYLMQSKLDDALKYANIALGLYEAAKSPLLNEGQYLVGLIYYYQGDKDNAKKYLKLAKKNGAEIHPQLEKELKL